jgi:pimeloyl-ACP methyl ester carboxylesterase
MDLPGHGADADGDTAVVRLEECVHAIVRAVDREELKNVVLVGHGFAGGLLLQAAAAMPKPPKRLVLVAAIVPVSQRSMLSALPRRVRAGFRLLAGLSKLSRQSFKFPRLVIGRFMCNGMDPMEIIHSLGFFGPLPNRVLKTRLDLGGGPPPCPVTYVLLTQDKVVPPEVQERMAQRLPGAEIVSVDSCHQVTLFRPRELADILLRYA